MVGVGGFAAASAAGRRRRDFEVLVTGRALQGVFRRDAGPGPRSRCSPRPSPTAKERAKGLRHLRRHRRRWRRHRTAAGRAWLTEHLNWRWNPLCEPDSSPCSCWPGRPGLPQARRPAQPSQAGPGSATLLVSAGLFGLVYGFSKRRDPTTGPRRRPGGFLAAGGLLLALFTWWQTRAAHPLLPLRVLLDRNRGASFLVVAISGRGIVRGVPLPDPTTSRCRCTTPGRSARPRLPADDRLADGPPRSCPPSC